MNTRSPTVESLQPFTDPGDGTHHLMTWDANGTLRVHAVVAVKDAQIRPADAGGEDFDQQFTRTDLRNGNFLDPQVAGTVIDSS